MLSGHKSTLYIIPSIWSLRTGIANWCDRNKRNYYPLRDTGWEEAWGNLGPWHVVSSETGNGNMAIYV